MDELYKSVENEQEESYIRHLEDVMHLHANLYQEIVTFVISWWTIAITKTIYIILCRG